MHAHTAQLYATGEETYRRISAGAPKGDPAVEIAPRMQYLFGPRAPELAVYLIYSATDQELRVVALTLCDVKPFEAKNLSRTDFSPLLIGSLLTKRPSMHIDREIGIIYRNNPDMLNPFADIFIRTIHNAREIIHRIVEEEMYALVTHVFANEAGIQKLQQLHEKFSPSIEARNSVSLIVYLALMVLLGGAPSAGDFFMLEQLDMLGFRILYRRGLDAIPQLRRVSESPKDALRKLLCSYDTALLLFPRSDLVERTQPPAVSTVDAEERASAASTSARALLERSKQAISASRPAPVDIRARTSLLQGTIVRFIMGDAPSELDRHVQMLMESHRWNTIRLLIRIRQDNEKPRDASAKIVRLVSHMFSEDKRNAYLAYGTSDRAAAWLDPMPSDRIRGAYTIVDSDLPEDYLRLGTASSDVRGCRTNYEPLVSLIYDPSVRLVYVHNDARQMVASTFIRLIKPLIDPLEIAIEPVVGDQTFENFLTIYAYRKMRSVALEGQTELVVLENKMGLAKWKKSPYGISFMLCNLEEAARTKKSYGDMLAEYSYLHITNFDAGPFDGAIFADINKQEAVQRDGKRIVSATMRISSEFSVPPDLFAPRPSTSVLSSAKSAISRSVSRARDLGSSVIRRMSSLPDAYDRIAKRQIRD
jgi:hypothetical protein